MQGVVESLLQGGVIGGVSGGALAGVLGGANQAKAKQAEQTAQMIEQLNNLAKASKVLTRSPETYEQFIQHASENGPVSHLYIDANALMQTGLAEQVAALSPSVNEQLPLAAQTGGKISIPVAEYTTKIAPNEVLQPLVEHLTVDPNDYSRVEANHYMQTEGEQLKQSMEAILAPKLEESNFRQSKESLKVKFLNELNDLGHWSNPANEAYASHLANFFSVMASRAGMTPEEMHAQFPVNFASEMAQGSYGQVLPNAMPEGMEVGDADKLAAMYRKEDQAKSVLLGQTNPRLTEDGLKVNAYLNTFSHSVDKSALNHIRKNHGDESTELNRGNLPITDEDISKIPDIIKDYDGVRFDLLSSYGKPVIAYVKKVSDGVLLYMEEVHNKRHDLSALSMRKYPTTTDAQNILKNASQNVRNGDGHENSIGKPPKSIKEIDKDTNVFNQDPTINRGSFNPETLTIALLKDANYSTFLHETGHFFLETQFSLASQLDKMAEDLGFDMLSEGEKGILNDTNALLKWFGVSDLNTWFAMSLDEKRSYHEQFARGFEAYLYEGKAPSIELAPLFQRFADWLKRVYQDIKSLNVTLNDEVRSVFDRMLASDAEIAQAKQARSMMALFAKQEDSPMSPEEFAEYQDVLTRWTDTAQEQLQSRLLRDLVWLGKAKPKVLKALMQTGLAEQVAALSPSVNEQLPLAAQTGGKISIPVAEYTTKIAPNEVLQPLVEHLTVDPNDYSRVEANHYMQTEGEQLKQSMEAILAPKLEESNFRQSKESLKVKFLNELNDLGHWSNPANEAYASHLANFFSVMASRAGMTPEEMHTQFPVNFASEMAQGRAGYNQNDNHKIIKQLEPENPSTLPKEALLSELRKTAKDYYVKNLVGTKVIHPELGEIEFSNRGLKKALSTSANPIKPDIPHPLLFRISI